MDPCPEPTDVQEESCVFLSSAVLEPAWSPRRELWQQPPAAVTVSVPPGTESLPLCGQGTAQAYKHPRVTPPQMRDLGSCFVAVPAPAGRGPFAAPSETWVQSRQADPAPEAGPGRILGSCGGCQACFRVSPGCHILSGRGARVWAVRWSRLCPGWGWGWGQRPVLGLVAQIPHHSSPFHQSADPGLPLSCGGFRPEPAVKRVSG